MTIAEYTTATGIEFVPSFLNQTKANLKKCAKIIQNFGSAPVESFLLIEITPRKNIGKIFEMSRGGVAATIVDTTVVMRKIVREEIKNFTVWHNHPAQNPLPSKNDLDAIARLGTAASRVGVPMTKPAIIVKNGVRVFDVEY